MHSDKVGNPLAIGDEVAYAVGARSTRLEIGTILSFTPKRIRVQGPLWRSDHQPDRVLKVIREG